MDKSKIKTATEALVEEVRAYVRGQADLWQRVPGLAFKADGRSGFNDLYRVAYNCGIWMLGCSMSQGSYQVAVDCSDGALVTPFHFLELGQVKPAHMHDILLLTKELEELDAANVVRYLRSRSREPVSKFIRESNSNWFANVRPTIKVPRLFGLEDRKVALAKRKK